MSAKYGVKDEKVSKVGGMKNKYEINGDQTIIYLKYKGATIETIIETKDLDELIALDVKWHAWKPTRMNGKCYVKANAKSVNGFKKVIYLHRIICKPPEDLLVDHINRNPLDNRRSNLRPATHQMNMNNRDYKNIGVSFHKSTNKWKAYIRVDGKQKQLGRFMSEEDAKNAVSEARIKFAV